MADLRTNKLDAARRQTDAAIRLFFANEDPFAIHTIAAAAQRILRDIAEKRGNSQWHEAVKQLIRPGMENRFWAATNKAANFLKHADSDADEILEVGEEVNDLTILSCCVYYTSLGFESTPEMRGFFSWHMVMYPELLLDSDPRKKVVSGHDFDWWRAQPREKRLSYGQELVALARRQR